MKTTTLAEDVSRYESGQMDAQETVQFFQDLVDTDRVCQLPPQYARTAAVLIWAGLVVNRRECK